MSSTTIAAAPVRAYKATDAPQDGAPLETTHGAPAPLPFKPDAGTWINTGLGSILGIGAGAVAGLVLGVGFDGAGPDWAVAAVIGVSLLAGGFVGGKLAYDHAESDYHATQRAGIQAKPEPR